VVNVAHRANVDVWLVALEFRFAHCSSLLLLLVTVKTLACSVIHRARA
jgi:hypothetical protein